MVSEPVVQIEKKAEKHLMYWRGTLLPSNTLSNLSSSVLSSHHPCKGLPRWRTRANSRHFRGGHGEEPGRRWGLCSLQAESEWVRGRREARSLGGAIRGMTRQVLAGEEKCSCSLGLGDPVRSIEWRRITAAVDQQDENELPSPPDPRIHRVEQRETKQSMRLLTKEAVSCLLMNYTSMHLFSPMHGATWHWKQLPIIIFFAIYVLQLHDSNFHDFGPVLVVTACLDFSPASRILDLYFDLILLCVDSGLCLDFRLCVCELADLCLFLWSLQPCARLSRLGLRNFAVDVSGICLNKVLKLNVNSCM